MTSPAVASTPFWVVGGGLAAVETVLPAAAWRAPFGCRPSAIACSGIPEALRQAH